MRTERAVSSLGWEFIQKASTLGLLFCNYGAPEHKAKEQIQKITTAIVQILRTHPQPDLPGSGIRLTQGELFEAAFTFLFEPLDFIENRFNRHARLQDHPLLRTCRSLKSELLHINLPDMGGRYGRYSRSSLFARIDRYFDDIKRFLVPPAPVREPAPASHGPLTTAIRI